MEQAYRKLKKMFFNPRTGFISADKLYRKLKEKDTGLSLKQVRDWVRKQEVQQIHKQRGKVEYNRIIALGLGYSLQVDLLDLSNYKSKNKGYRYILLVVDVYSRYAFA